MWFQHNSQFYSFFSAHGPPKVLLILAGFMMIHKWSRPYYTLGDYKKHLSYFFVSFALDKCFFAHNFCIKYQFYMKCEMKVHIIVVAIE